jgi:uncharacterized protein YndB with AHSA1/START domain
MPSETDRIEKVVVLRASRSRVFRALTDSKEFGAWFGVRFEAPFVPGARMTGTIVPTTADPEVAKTQHPYEGATFEIVVDRIEPEKLFSFRWHPFAVDKTYDYSKEEMTLVEFTLSDTSGGTRLTVTETGFDKIPLARRAKALEMNTGGWAAQMRLIEKYLGDA